MEWEMKQTPESPFKTIDETKTAFLKIQVSWDGSWGFLIRFFGFKPSDAKQLVDSWAMV
jgi:hypothetical protein